MHERPGGPAAACQEVSAVPRPRFQLVPGARIGGGVGWRLLGANNRELGRSTAAYADAEAALAAIERVRGLVAEGEAHVVHDAGSGHWAWHMVDAGVPVASSGRGFRLQRECRYNVEQFRREAPGAPVSG